MNSVWIWHSLSYQGLQQYGHNTGNHPGMAQDSGHWHFQGQTEVPDKAQSIQEPDQGWQKEHFRSVKMVNNQEFAQLEKFKIKGKLFSPSVTGMTTLTSLFWTTSPLPSRTPMSLISTDTSLQWKICWEPLSTQEKLESLVSGTTHWGWVPNFEVHMSCQSWKKTT